jgi:hypothetical protein
MKKLCGLLATVVVLLCSSGQLLADGILISWSPEYLEGASQATFDAAKALSIDAIIANNARVASWPDAYHLVIAANEHKNDKAFLRRVAAQLGDTTTRKLTATSRLIIWERITSGDILFEGKGLQVSDDLFSVAGRANWVLRTVTHRKFGYVRPDTDPSELKKIQARWLAWLSGEPVAEIPDAYPTAEKGLEEIRSLEALEALIVSLKPSPAKGNLTKHCLATMYQLSELPSDPANPARLCSPDTYAALFLAQLTDVEGEHDSSWWGMWWSAQRQSLKWDPKSGKFRVAKSKNAH